MSVSNEIIKVLDLLAEKFGIAVDWTSQNIIPYLEQLCGRYINYKITISIIWLILGIICLFVGKWGIKKVQYCYKRCQEDMYNDWGIGAVFLGIGTGFIILMGVIIIIYQLFNITTCATFPEKIILDELMLIYSSM